MRNIVFIHGALGSKEQMLCIASKFDADHNVHVIDLPGHGKRSGMDNTYDLHAFADDAIACMEEAGIEHADIFGYSMGGYVGLIMAQHMPERVGRIATLGTKFEWSPEIASKEIKMLDPDVIESKVPKFADLLKSRHGLEHWESVLHRTAHMMIQLGKQNALTQEDFERIPHRSLIMIGDKDNMVTCEETLAVSKALPNGKYKLIKDTPHPMEQVDIDRITKIVRSFFEA